MKHPDYDRYVAACNYPWHVDGPAVERHLGRYHRLVVRYVWSQLNAGAQYVTEDQVVRRIRSFSARKRARLKSSKNPI